MTISVPSQMRFLAVPEPGGAEKLTLLTGPTPSAAEGEVLVRVHAAGVNRPDIAQRSGTYPPPPGASPVLGLEVAGEIVALGPNSGAWRVGDQICALTPGGGYAEYCRVPAGQCLPIPKGLSLEEAAALPETMFTVWTNVFERGRLRAGEAFLIHGGTSGIGVAAIQLAHAFGARVVATAGSAKKCDACRELGAELAVNYREQDFVAEVKRFTAGLGLDLILDMVGGPYFARNIDCLATEGRLVQIAVLQGAQGELNLGKLLAKRLTVMGSTLRPLPLARKSEIAASLRAKVWPLIEAGKVRVVIDRILPWEQARAAHERMESSEHIGKIVLKF